MANTRLLFSSENQKWATRWEYFNQIQDHLGKEFVIDCCAEEHTTKCNNFLTVEDDMFSIDSWRNHFNLCSGEQPVWMNPEYGRNQRKFMDKLVDQVSDTGYGVALVPARTDTKLFHELVLRKAEEVVFVKGRLTFGTDEYWEELWNAKIIVDSKGKSVHNAMYGKHGKMNPAPFPSMYVVFTDISVASCEGPKFSTLEASKVVYKKG
jgi:hypothetical protein